MISSTDNGSVGELAYACLSTDTKPTNCGNGALLLEIDTSKIYVYDEQHAIWREWV